MLQKIFNLLKLFSLETKKEVDFLRLFRFRRKASEEKLDLPPVPPPPSLLKEEPPTKTVIDEEIPRFISKKEVKRPKEELVPPKIEPPKYFGFERGFKPRIIKKVEKLEKPKVVTQPLKPEVKPVHPLHKVEEKPEVKVEEVKAHIREVRPPKEFIRVTKFNKVINSIADVKNELANLKGMLTKIENINSIKDSQLNRWCEIIEIINKKLLYTDQTLFKGEL